MSNRIPHQSSSPVRSNRFGTRKITQNAEARELATRGQNHRRAKIHKTISILYYLLLLAQVLMCILETVRLSLARLGIGLLPFTFVTLITAAAVRFTRGFEGTIFGWEYVNLAVWIALAVTNGVKVAEETKEGTGARRGSKYPVADQVTDVSVMIGVYVGLAILEISLGAVGYRSR